MVNSSTDASAGTLPGSSSLWRLWRRSGGDRGLSPTHRPGGWGMRLVERPYGVRTPDGSAMRSTVKVTVSLAARSKAPPPPVAPRAGRASGSSPTSPSPAC